LCAGMCILLAMFGKKWRFIMWKLR
jgi:hypothetical protein